MRLGDTIFHRTFGVGEIREFRKMGREAFVTFSSGISGTFAISELKIFDISTKSQKVTQNHKENPQTERQNVDIESKNVQEKLPPSIKIKSNSHNSYNVRFRARQMIEALRLGIVPSFQVDDITVGLKKERESIEQSFDEALQNGGDARAIVGEYGTGKSHLFEWTANEALKRNFLVARISLDIDETPPNKPHKIYNALINSLKFPDRTDGGSLSTILSHFSENKHFAEIQKKMEIIPWAVRLSKPFETAILGYRNSFLRGDDENMQIILNWISGENLLLSQVRKASGGCHIPKVNIKTRATDLYSYLLSGISWLAQQMGYSGLLILLDESEHYSLLSSPQKYISKTFFQGLIYSALQNRQSLIPSCNCVSYADRYSCGLSHGTPPYPYSFSKNCGLIFMFAVTLADDSFNYKNWLDQKRIIRLETLLSSEELEVLFTRISKLHASAFNYTLKDQNADLKKKLISRYSSGLCNLRELIKTFVEICDLTYLYTDYEPAFEE